MEDSRINQSFSYTRVIDEGVPIDVSEIASSIGIQYPISITCDLYSRFLSPTATERRSKQVIQDRLYSVLHSLVIAAKFSRDDQSYVYFSVPIILESGQITEVKLLALSYGWGDGDAVITIMLEGEK